MKNLTSSFILLLLLGMPIASAQDEAFGEEFDKTLDKIEETHKKIKELIDSYEKAKQDVVKTEDITIVDQNGNGQSCTFEVFYNNGQVTEMKTDANGKASGNINHGQTWPTGVISFRLSGCACTVKKVDHKWGYPSFDEHINRLKTLLRDEVTDKVKDKGKSAAEDAVKKAFEKAGAGSLAAPFLAGFGYGADLGAPIGDYITSQINQIVGKTYEMRLAEAEQGLLAPRGVHRVRPRWKPPLIGGLVEYLRTDPILKNTWNIQVQCRDGEPTPLVDVQWNDYKYFKPRPAPPSYTGGTQADPAEKELKEREERERREREEQERKDREEQERRDREEKEREQKAKEERERRQRELEEKAKQIALECKICDPIRQEIEKTEQDIAEKEKALATLEQEVTNAQSEAAKAKNDLARAKQQLSDFNNPRSSAESGGRRVTSSDLAIDRMVARGQLQRYQDGEISAQELEQEWGRYDDAARDAAKTAYKKKLEQDIKDLETKSKDAEKKLSDKQAETNRARQSLANLKKYLDDLHKKLDECLKRCKEKAQDIAKGTITSWEDLIAKEESTVAAPQISQRTECDKYALLLEKYGLTTDKAATMSEAEFLERGMSESMHTAMLQYKKRCDETTALTTPVTTQTSTGTQQIVTEPEPTTPKSCEEICSEKGRSTTKTDWNNYILGELNSKGTCASSATIGFPTILKTGTCTCYSTQQPSISISSQKLVCRNTACGDVACGSSATCSCGENCMQTVSCEWGGWKRIGETAYQPTVGAQN